MNTHAAAKTAPVTVFWENLATEHAQLQRVALAASQFLAAQDAYAPPFNALNAYNELVGALDDLPIHLIGFEVVTDET